MKDIERYTKCKLVRHNIPTIADVEEKKVSAFFKQVKETIKDSNLSKQTQWIENLCEEEGLEAIEIAAALVKLALGDEEKEEIIEEKSSYKEESSRKGRRERKRGKLGKNNQEHLPKGQWQIAKCVAGIYRHNGFGKFRHST